MYNFRLRMFLVISIIITCVSFAHSKGILSVGPKVGLLWIQGDLVRATYGGPIPTYGLQIETVGEGPFQLTLFGLHAEMSGDAPFTLPIGTGIQGSAPVHHSRDVIIIGTTYRFDPFHNGLLVPFIATGTGVCLITENTDPTTVPPLPMPLPAATTNSVLWAGHFGVGIEVKPLETLSASIGATFLGIPTKFDDPYQLPGVKEITNNAGGALLFLDILYTF